MKALPRSRRHPANREREPNQSPSGPPPIDNVCAPRTARHSNRTPPPHPVPVTRAANRHTSIRSKSTHQGGLLRTVVLVVERWRSVKQAYRVLWWRWKRRRGCDSRASGRCAVTGMTVGSVSEWWGTGVAVDCVGVVASFVGRVGAGWLVCAWSGCRSGQGSVVGSEQGRWG